MPLPPRAAQRETRLVLLKLLLLLQTSLAFQPTTPPRAGKTLSRLGRSSRPRGHQHRHLGAQGKASRGDDDLSMIARKVATLPVSDLRVHWKRPDAAGGFGAVYFGETAAAQQVVVKVAFNDNFAEKLLDNELHFNRLLATNIPAHHGRRWARILGTCRPRRPPLDDFPSEISSAHMLVFAKENGRTLEEYLSSSSADTSLSEALHITEPAAKGGQGAGSGKTLRLRLFAKVLGELMCCLVQLHRTGLIHRDIKPENLLVVPGDRTCPIKMIDFGSACDMGAPIRRGLFEETVDPLYCPPELRVTTKHPTSFDVFCAAVTSLRVLCPSLGADPALVRQVMSEALPACGYNMMLFCRQQVAEGKDHRLAQECRELLAPENAWAAHILTKMLSQNARARPTPTAVLTWLGPLWAAQLRSVEMLATKATPVYSRYGLCGRLARQLRQDPSSIVPFVGQVALLAMERLLRVLPVDKALTALVSGTSRAITGLGAATQSLTKRLIGV